jgi:hypothetical protein
VKGRKERRLAWALADVTPGQDPDNPVWSIGRGVMRDTVIEALGIALCVDGGLAGYRASAMRLLRGLKAARALDAAGEDALQQAAQEKLAELAAEGLN